MASSSTHHHNHTPYAATAAPPPTPSTATDTPDALSLLLRRLPPTLSLRRRSSAVSTTVTPTTVDLSDPTTSPLLSAATQIGFFQLLPTKNFDSNNSDPENNVYYCDCEPAFITANKLFNLSDGVKHTIVPKNWPIGYEGNEDHINDDDATNESFCFEVLDHHSTLTEDELGLNLNLSCLHELGSELKKTGLEVIDKLGDAAGFKNPDPSKLSYQMWVSNGSSKPGLVYPYAIGLHCVVRSCEKYSLLTDSGWVNACGLQAGSVLVTLGDIAQVWSNGKFKKVRGRAVPCMSSDNNDSSSITMMSLLITLPLESIVSPLVPNIVIIDEGGEEEDGVSLKDDFEKCQFRPFSFEDYAWRVYHERILTKDPLVRYRV